MATQSILRSGMSSPVRAMLKTTNSTRSILKRPGGLPLSPAFAASFSVLTSPRLHSPHVQFLSSPSLVSTFATHSAASYDRAPISVSPLERTYQTSLEDFKLSAPPKPFRSISAAQNSPAITDFEDPRSPKIQPAAKENALRFAAFSSNQTVTRPSRTLAKSLASYPRSPYPSAPLTATRQDEVGWPKHDDTDDSLTHRTRSFSLDLPKRNKKGLTLASYTVTSVAPTPSSLGRSIFSPSVASVNRAKKPAPLDLECRLSQDFWQSFSLEESAKTDDEQVMVTALEYPESAVGYEGQMYTDTQSQPQIMYGGADGAIWSPGIPKPGAALDKIRESFMSPGKRSSFSRIARKDFTAPTPNDPFATFPSFTAAFEMGLS